jgi:hypothetical protein
MGYSRKDLPCPLGGNFWIRISKEVVGGLTSNCLNVGGMDVFLNDQMELQAKLN